MSRNQNKKNSPRIEKKSNYKKSNKENKTKKFSFFSIILTCFFILIILMCSCFGYYFIKEDFNAGKAWTSMINKISIKPRSITMLILGVSTDISTELADTIMVCSYNPSTEKAYIISIPRDTFIGTNKNSAKGRDKINSMYSRGPEVMVEKVEELTNLNIDYYAVVKNDALIKIVDAIGGVTFNVPINMNYDDVTQNLHIHLNSGVQLIDGEKAEQLLRFRHNNDGSSYPSSYGDNDFGRMRTQRDFIKETARQTLNLGNIFKIPKISKAVFDNLETDISFFTTLKYIPSALWFDIDSLETYQLPGESKKCNSLWLYIHDSNETMKLINELTQKINQN